MSAGKDRVFVSVHRLRLLRPYVLAPANDRGAPQTISPDASFLLFSRWDDDEGSPLPFAGALNTDHDRWDEIGTLRFEALLALAGARVTLPDEEKDRVRRFLAKRCPGAQIEFLLPGRHLKSV